MCIRDRYKSCAISQNFNCFKIVFLYGISKFLKYFELSLFIHKNYLKLSGIVEKKCPRLSNQFEIDIKIALTIFPGTQEISMLTKYNFSKTRMYFLSKNFRFFQSISKIWMSRWINAVAKLRAVIWRRVCPIFAESNKSWNSREGIPTMVPYLCKHEIFFPEIIPRGNKCHQSAGWIVRPGHGNGRVWAEKHVIVPDESDSSVQAHSIKTQK